MIHIICANCKQPSNGNLHCLKCESNFKTHLNKPSFQQQNVDKYGEKQYDEISNAYRISKTVGDAFCAISVRKYLLRFINPKSHKRENLTDLVKCRDFIDRMIEQNQQSTKTEIIE